MNLSKELQKKLIFVLLANSFCLAPLSSLADSIKQPIRIAADSSTKSTKDAKDDSSDDSKDESDSTDEAKDKSKTGAKKAKAHKETFPLPTPKDTVTIQSTDLVKDPKKYLHKDVRFTTKFFSFSNLALDYKPAFRSSKDYLSILILRPNSHVPLSELKIAIPMSKDNVSFNKVLATLKDGDRIEIVGREFSTALGDPWLDVINLKRLDPPKPDKDDEDDKVSAESMESPHDKKNPLKKDKKALPPELNGIKK